MEYSLKTIYKTSQLATASHTNEAIDNMLETIENNSIRGHIVSEIRNKIEPIITQKLKPLLENSESLIKSVKETCTSTQSFKRSTTLQKQNY